MRHFAAALCLLISAAVCAQTGTERPLETSSVFGDYEVFYNVFPSTMLKPDIAASYRIVRGNNRAVVNIAVRKKQPGGGDREQAATVSGSYSDLIHKKPLEFRQIDEPGAIYYIAELRHTDKELLRFDIQVQPNPDAPAYRLTFTRKLYIDPEQPGR